MGPGRAILNTAVLATFGNMRWGEPAGSSPDGADRPAPQTFATKKAAQVWWTLKESEIKRGDWLDPSAGAMPFAKHAADWLDQRQLSPKTAQLYELSCACTGATRPTHVFHVSSVPARLADQEATPVAVSRPSLRLSRPVASR